MPSVQIERLDHLGIVTGLCQEIGLAAYLDALAGPNAQQVSIGTATTTMILNGLGFSNRRLYLISQYFASKPVERVWSRPPAMPGPAAPPGRPCGRSGRS
jgi:hypothetical protein